MIFRENLSTTTSKILPLIKNNKNEIKEESQERIEILNENKFQTRNLTIDAKNSDNNRYNLETEIFNDMEKVRETNKESRVHTITNSRNLTSDNVLYNYKSPFIAKVTLDNIRNKKDCIYLLEEYLKLNNIISYYEINNEQDKIIFSFYDEKIAFEFTKIIYNEKNKNSLYKNVVVHLNLFPNKKYLKWQKLEKRKRGISYESIIKLYKGSSYIKKIKEFPKIKGNINFGIECPFYNVNNNKKNKLNSNKVLKNKNYISRNNRGDIFGYVNYDGQPLKSYEKLRISVLDTHYNPFCNYKYRQDNKNKWVSPSNFKFY